MCALPDVTKLRSYDSGNYFEIGLAAKNVLNIDDVAILTGMSKGYIYQLTHKRIIPFYKPTGKQMYFDRSEIEAWMKRNRYDTDDEIVTEALSFKTKKGGKI